jgi:DNA-binding transcriptional MerR regulator
MYKEHKVEKVYWTMGEAKKIIGVTRSAIRYWMHEFDIRAKRNKGSHRQLTAENIKILLKIKFMQDEGYHLDGVKKNINKYDFDENKNLRRVKL